MPDKREIDRKMKVRRTRNQLAGSLEKLEADKTYYIEKAKTARLKGETATYKLARSGLASTLSRYRRTREMLLNIDITAQMRDTAEATRDFLTGMESLFKEMSRLNKSIDLKTTCKQLREAIAGTESMRLGLDEMLDETDAVFEQAGGEEVSAALLDEMLGVEAEEEEQRIMGALDEILTPKDAPKEKIAVRETPAAAKRVAETPAPSARPAPAPAAPAPAASAPPVKRPDPPARQTLGLRFFEYDYEFPPVDLLDDYTADAALREENAAALSEDAAAVEKVLSELKVDARVADTVVGPTYSRLEMVMPAGVSVNKVDGLLDDIAMSLGKRIRFEVPIPGKNAFGIEVPNRRRETVGLKELIVSQRFRQAEGGIQYCLALDLERNSVIKDLSRAPHMLIAGSTGSGKSCFLHALITSLLYKYSPNDLKFLIVDFKRVEMAAYNGLPFLLTDKVVDNEDDALDALRQLVELMDARYGQLIETGCRNVDEYNAKAGHMPRVAVVIDEYADIATSAMSKEFNACILKLAQKARASGIHLILATQRPSTDVVSGTVKNNFPTQVAFKVARKEDSRTTLAGLSGAEALLGNGDLLFNEAGAEGLKRMQAPFISSEEIRRVVNFVKDHTVRRADDGTV